jgi:hypothetical protein
MDCRLSREKFLFHRLSLKLLAAAPINLRVNRRGSADQIAERSVTATGDGTTAAPPVGLIFPARHSRWKKTTKAARRI